MRRLFLFALILAAVGYASVHLGERGARAIERLLADRVAQGLAVLQLDWAQVRVDGLDVTLSGHAPDGFARDLALESARATAPIARITDYMTYGMAPPPAQQPILVEMLRDKEGLTLTGRFQGERMRARLLAALAEAAPGLTVHDLTGVNAARPDPGWGPELIVAAHAAARVPNAYVRIEPGQVRVDGLARDEEHRAELAGELLTLAGSDVRLVLELRKPLVVAAPFAFAIDKDAAGGMRLEVCAARDAGEQATLEALLVRAGLDIGAGRCPEALGGPPGDWTGAVVAGIDALARLPAGRFRLEYRSAELHGAPPTSTAELEAALVVLATALPEGYALLGSLKAENAGRAVAMQQARYWMRLVRVADTVVLSGQVSDNAARRLVETHAAARFGRTAVHSALEVGGQAAPPGWEAAAMVALDALAGLEAGAAELTAGQLSLKGRLADPARAGGVHRLMEGEVPQGYKVTSALSVDLPRQVAAVPLGPARCAVALGAAVREAPVTFAPGSAVIEADSRPVLDRLAGILARCPEGRVEISGHTDSQGSEALNRALSQARAEAVLDAMLARGIRLDRLAARGYGEDQPIASNATEEGRSLNRRIEFRAVQTEAAGQEAGGLQPGGPEPGGPEPGGTGAAGAGATQ